MTPEPAPHERRATLWTLLIVAIALQLAVVLIPVWLIQPFRAQSTRGIALSYALRTWSPVLTLAGLAFAAGLIIPLWHGRGWWRKPALIILAAVAVLPIWLARQNHFEWMFNALPRASYASVGDASFVADTDVVMAVVKDGDAAAYPVRLMAYHHVVHDLVGGTPIVATY